jgi:hypothetical protein
MHTITPNLLELYKVAWPREEYTRKKTYNSTILAISLFAKNQTASEPAWHGSHGVVEFD